MFRLVVLKWESARNDKGYTNNMDKVRNHFPFIEIQSSARPRNGFKFSINSLFIQSMGSNIDSFKEPYYYSCLEDLLCLKCGFASF